jgi:hypothetical protein
MILMDLPMCGIHARLRVTGRVEAGRVQVTSRIRSVRRLNYDTRDGCLSEAISSSQVPLSPANMIS